MLRHFFRVLLIAAFWCPVSLYAVPDLDIFPLLEDPLNVQKTPLAHISLKTQEDAAHPILRFIQTAQKNLQGCVYKLDYVPIITALLEAQKRGVSVTLLVEQTPYQHPGSDQAITNMDVLRKSGIVVLPFLHASKDSQLHAKFLIADEKRLFLTTMNWDRESFLGAQSWHATPPAGDAPTRDIALTFEESGLVIEAMRAMEWAQTGYKKEASGESLLNFGPCFSTRTYITKILSTAKKSLHIWQQSVQDDAMVDLLVGLQRKGIQVSLVMTEDPFNASLKGKSDGNLPNLCRLTESGAHIYRLSSFAFPYIHMKGVLIDGEKFLFTSSNFYAKSLDEGFEVSSMVEDPTLVKRLMQTFQNDISSAALFKTSS